MNARKGVTGLAAALLWGVGCAIPPAGPVQGPPARQESSPPAATPYGRVDPGAGEDLRLVGAEQGPELLPPPAPAAPPPAPAPAPCPADGARADAPGELTLLEVVQLALAANPDLQSAAERTQYAEEVLARARADFFPVLAFNENYQTSDNPLRKFSFLLSQGQTNPGLLFNPGDVVDNFHSQLRLQQEVYNGGLRVARSLSAEADIAAAHHALAASQNRIAFQVAEAYYRLFQARELVKVREESVKQVEKQLETVQARFKAQTATRADVLMVELRLAQERETLITSKNALELARAVLENVAGVPLAGRVLPEKLPPAPWSAHVEGVLAALERTNGAGCDGPLSDAVAEAILRRPEVGEIGSRIQSAQHLVRAAESGKHPTLSFVGDYDVFTGDFRAQSTEGSFFVGLAFSVNLFDGGRTRASVRQAEAKVRDLTAQDRRARLDVTLDVRRAYLQYRDASERLKVARVSVKSAEENLRAVESLYAGQRTTVTELLGAQVALSDARVKVTSGEAEVEVARAALERALGALVALLAPHGDGAGCPPLPVLSPWAVKGPLPAPTAMPAGVVSEAGPQAPPPREERRMWERILGGPWQLVGLEGSL